MCKHVLNAQVSIRAPCCRKWFDCPQCHDEASDHELVRATELALMCKKCHRAFRLDMNTFDPETDVYCPNCDNCFDLPAETPETKGKFVLELEGAGGSTVQHSLGGADVFGPQ